MNLNQYKETLISHCQLLLLNKGTMNCNQCMESLRLFSLAKDLLPSYEAALAYPPTAPAQIETH